MPSTFSPSFKNLQMKDPRVAARVVVGVLLLANLVAAAVAFHPWGGSAEDLRRQRDQLGQQVAAIEARLAHSRALVAKVEHARAEGDQFLAEYVTDRRVSTSTIVAELTRTAKEAGIQPKEVLFADQEVEGSDTLWQWTITAGFEGTYQNLTKFVNLLDKSPRFLIIENMQAAPQQTGQILNVSFKLDMFVRTAPGSAS
jgi:Tfp pilus assembly protein PilO